MTPPTRKLLKSKSKDAPSWNLNTILLFGAVGAIMIVLGTQLYISLNPFDNILRLDLEPKQNTDGAMKMMQDLDLAVKPFEGSEFPLGPIFDGDQPVWGTLNGGHYFGMKLSSPESLELSMMWFKNELDKDGRLSLRHLCNQNDRLDSYSWTKHDFHSFGVQTIDDDNYRIKTSFVKSPLHHNDWKARIEFDYINSTKLSKPISVIQYIMTNHNDDLIQIKSFVGKLGQLDDPFLIEGLSKHIGRFKTKVTVLSRLPHQAVYTSFFNGRIDRNRNLAGNFLHSRMTSVLHNGSRIFVLPGSPKPIQYDDIDQPNIIAHQTVLDSPAVIEIEFTCVNNDSKQTREFSFDDAIEAKIEEFDTKFARTFPISKIDSSTQTTIGDDVVDRLAKLALSNMLGSVSYFHGLSFIGSSSNPNHIAPYGPIQLLSGVPSRSFFPRGFLWDEGFHNLLISRWDPDLSNKIIKSWFNIMNINGWIPREVILGIESMSRVPHEFIVQRISDANPPAMFLAIEYLSDNGLLEQDTIQSIYPRLKTWYQWFNSTQVGIKASTFRWRGRDELSVEMLNPKTLTSGLDDYPRASHPSEQEYHVDLRCWMALAARTLGKVARTTGIELDKQFLARISEEASELEDNRILDELHWSHDNKMYCDYGHNTEKSELVRVVKRRKSQTDGSIETYRALERQSTGQPIFGCVPEFGYVSLFPMILNILDAKSDKLGLMLDRMRDEKELWSPFGVRSLSKSSKYYNKQNTEHDKPYWRGAVWLNINYLILSSLRHYSLIEGPHRERCAEIFAELRQILINNVMKEFSRTNYLWENYDDQSGHGQGSHPFTGWSSLIVLIMSSPS